MRSSERNPPGAAGRSGRGLTLPRLGLAAGAAGLMFSLVMAALPRDGLIAHTVPDDAFYYFSIARRFGEPSWPSFDGLHTTTGFHPLWLFVLVPFGALSKGDPWLLPRAAVLLSALLMLGASYLFSCAVARDSGREQGLLTLAIFAGNLGLSRLGVMGMEAPLGIFFFAAFWWSLTAERPRPALTGLLAGLAVLGRLDLAIAVACAVAFRAYRLRRLGEPAVVTAFAALTIAPYLAWNLVLTGHWSTVSSATKAFVVERTAEAEYGGRLTLGFALSALRELGQSALFIGKQLVSGPPSASLAVAGGDHPSYVNASSVLPATIAIFCAIVAAALFLSGRTRCSAAPALARTGQWDLLIVLAAASSAHLLTSAALLKGHSGSWYWGLELMTLLLAVSSVAIWRPRLLRLVTAIAWVNILSLAALAAVLWVTGARGRLDGRPSFSGGMVELARLIPAHVPPGEPVGSGNAGTLGFQSSRPVINVDGLVNDFAFLDARRRNDVRAYLTRSHIRWIADCQRPEKMPEFASSLGISEEEIRMVERIDVRECSAFLWEIGLVKSSAAQRAPGFGAEPHRN